MATPRKHWWRVSDEVQYEPWSNDVAATFLRLGAHLNTRWAREGKNGTDASSVVLSRATAMQLTGSGSLARARSILRELATHVTLVIDEQGTNTSVRWPKYSEFQKYESRPGVQVETVEGSAVPPPQDAPARRKTQDAKEKSAAAGPEPDGSDALTLNGHRSDKQTKAKQAREAVRKIWPECQAAAAQHGRHWRALSDPRLRKMASRLSEHGPDPNVLVQAIHGAVAYWSKSKPDGDLIVHLTPDTIYSEKFSKYLEAATDPKTAPVKDWDKMTQEEKKAMRLAHGYTW